MVVELAKTDIAPLRVRASRATPHDDPFRGVVEPLRVFFLSRVLVFACACVAVAFVDPDPARGPWPGIGGPRIALLQAFGRWDGAWYMDVAGHGYHAVAYGHAGHASEAFFPAYPMFVRTFSLVTGASTLVASLLVTTVFAAAAAVLVSQLMLDISGRAAARRAVILFCFSPGAFVLSMAYSEALFVAATAASLLALIRRRWWFAGGFAALATMTRPNGIALVVACAACAFVAIHARRDWSALVAPLVGATGIVAYFAFLFVKSGHPLQWFDVERSGWSDRVSPISGIVDHLTNLGSASLRPGGLNDLVWIASLLVAAIAVVVCVLWRPPVPVLTYAVVAAVVAASSYQVGIRPRLLLDAFPLLLAPAAVLRGAWYRTLVVVSVVGLVVLSILSFGTLASFP